jgi:hypothetical protein
MTDYIKTTSEMSTLISEIDKLVSFEVEQTAYVSRPLLAYSEKWLSLSADGKVGSLLELKDALTDGLDVDFTGTEWEKEWLADGNICQCKACVTARNCLPIIEELTIVAARVALVNWNIPQDLPIAHIANSVWSVGADYILKSGKREWLLR